ncbi:hypothetical protein ACS91J_15830 [Pectobacterium carotovorum]
MSESNKPSGEQKPQPTPPAKPAPQPAERNLRTGYTFVADSAENLRKKGK